jgi:hypothetical protein
VVTGPLTAAREDYVKEDAVKEDVVKGLRRLLQGRIVF